MAHLTLFSETDATISGLMEMVTVFSEFSSSSSETLYLILCFLDFILQNSFSKTYIAANSNHLNKAWLENEGNFSLVSQDF